MATGPVSSSLLSDSWTNLAAVEGSTEHTVVSFPRSAQDIKQILELKLAILSGGRDEMGREIIVFPARPAVKYDHKQILQTLQYLSSIPSPEALELGFTVIVDGRWLSWPDIKLILRTTQEALPGAVHVAYVLQPNQFMKKKSVSLSLSKERDKLEFTIVTASSTDKLLRHIDGRQIPVELGGAINYKHNEWIALRIKLEELTAAYQLYLESFNDHESHLKSVQLGASPPGPAGGRRGGAGGGDSIQQEIESLNKLKGRVESSDEPVNRLAAEVKELIETTSGSTGMSPEVISVLGKVNKILQLTSQQQSALMDLYQEKYRLVNEKHLMKQFETGTNKVVHWIKSKGLEEAGSVDIGESLAAALLLEEKLNKLTNKVESMKEDVTELKRLADVLRDFNESITDQELKRLHKKYSKFISTYKQRQSLVTRSVCMYRGLEEWRTLYDQLTVNWTKVKNSETDIDDCEELIKSLDNDNNRLKELAEAILLNGQELVKALKDTGVSQGDPEFRRSLRYISRTTDEVTDKARRSQEIALAKYARLDQYSQILVCEKDGKESIHKLSEILDTLKGRSTVIGDSLEATQNYIMELEEHKKEVDHTREYAKGLLASAVNQRETLGGDLSPNEVLQAELKEISSDLESTFALIRSLLQRLERIQTVHEGAESSIKYWGSERLFSDESSWSEIEQVLNNMEEKGGDLQTAVNICIKLGGELLQSLSADFDSESVQYIDTLHKSLIDQEIQLTSLLTTRRHELKNHQKLISVHQANEEVLLWIREQGLPHLTAYCSLRFSVSSIKETGNEFKTFKDNVNSLTASISAAAVPGDTSPLSLPLLSRVQKRSTDVDNIWKRFLIRVDNRERVLTSLDQFMNKVINLTTLMTDYVKGGSSCSPGSKREVDSSYQEVVADGRSLIALLHKSPGGTSDWDLADAVRDKLVQLESLLPRGGGGGGARKGTKPPLVSDESTHSVSVAPTHSVGVAPTHSVGVASKSERVRGLLKEMEDKKKTTNNNNNNYKEPSEETNNQRTETVAVTVNRIKEKEREGEEREEEKREGGTGLKEGQSVEPLVTVSNRHTSDEEFTHLEHATDQLMQKLLNRIDGFIKNHSSCPHSVAAARSELRDHTEFLQSLNSSIAQLKRVSETLKEDTSSSVKQKVLSLVSKVDRRIDERVSVLDKRTAAFKMITELHETSESCYRLLNSFSSSVPADIGSLSLHQLKVVLESCDTSLSGLEAAAAEYAKSTRSFTSLSTSLEMNGVEARRTVRGMLRHFETKLASTVDSYQRTRKIIVISEKQKKLLSWLVSTGLPAVSVTVLSTSLKGAELCFEEAQLFEKEAEVVTADINSVTTGIGSLSLPADSSLVLEYQELTHKYETFNERLSVKLQSLELCYEFFCSSSMLLSDLSFALSQGHELNHSIFNPLIAETQYTLATAMAKRLCIAAAAADNEGTVASVNTLLQEIEEKLSIYLLSCKNRSEDITVSLSKLDSFLEEIDQSVKEQLLEATGEKRPEHNTTAGPPSSVDTPGATGNTGTDGTAWSTGGGGGQFGAFRRSERPRQGSVHELKKMFEVKDEVPVSPVRSPLLPLKVIKRADQSINSANLSPTEATPTSESQVTDTLPHPPLPRPPSPPPPRPPSPSLYSSSPPPLRPPSPLMLHPPSPPPPRPPPPPDTPSTDEEVESDEKEAEFDGKEVDFDGKETESDGKEAESDDELLPDLVIEGHDFEEEAYIDVYEEMLLSKQELQMRTDTAGGEEGGAITARILSPVFEEEEEGGRDRPDGRGGIGSSPARRNSKTRADAQRAHEHRQSLQSMRSILSQFYKEEVEYTETLHKLVEVYAPILQYTGAFIQLQELLDFQLQFLNQLTSSLSNIIDLCSCFQVNMESFKLYFPYVIYYDTSLASLSQCTSDELSTLTGDPGLTNDRLINDYSAPYYRIEIYCHLFHRLLQAAYKEDLMSLAALSETLESILTILRKLSTEVAATRLYGCPFTFDVSQFISANPFLVHIANREKEVLLYMAFLHPEAIILAERQLDESRERTQYIYVMHLSTRGLLLIENYHGYNDRFAIFEKNQTNPDNIVVFRTCEDISVKDHWVHQLQSLLNEQAAELTPDTVLDPRVVEELAHLIPTNAPPPPGPDEKLQPLRQKKKRSKDFTDGINDHVVSDYTSMNSNCNNSSSSSLAPPTNDLLLAVNDALEGRDQWEEQGEELGVPFTDQDISPLVRRRLLYQAPFISVNDVPSNIQLDGVFSLPHPYMCTQDIVPHSPDSEYQLCLKEGQLVSVLDSKRDDWWLVSSPDNSGGFEEGWVECRLLQHVDYIRERCTDSHDGPMSSLNMSLWTVLADYTAGEEGTVSVSKGNLVEVIDNTQTDWALIRTIGQYPKEGWIPGEFISPYNMTHQSLHDEEVVSPLLRPTSAGADSSSTEGYTIDTYPLSPSLSIGELDNEEKRKDAAEHRDFTLMELLDSEREYIDRLSFCINNYKTNIEQSSSTPRALKTSATDLFGNIVDIYSFHKNQMLPQLESSPQDIVDLFALSGPQLRRLYVLYCKGKRRSEEIYREHFDYLQELSQQLKDRLSLRDYLILPVQRITKYNLLLKSLFELSIKAGTPVPHYKSALTATQEISRQANDVVHMSLIEGIEKRLEEFGELGLQDTFGVSDSQQRGTVKERRVFLFEKYLLITKRKSDGPDKGMYLIKETFLLQNVSFSEDTDPEKRNIVLYDISNGNKFTLKSSQTKVRNDWLSKASEFISVVRRPPALLIAAAGTRSRSASEPSDLVTAASINPAPSRQGSSKNTKRGTRAGRPSSASHTRGDKLKSGTQFVVMECIVLEGGDDCQLEPKEIVELVRVEPNGAFRIRTTDGQEGVIPAGFVRRRDAVTEGADMETAPKITISPPDQKLLLNDRFSVTCAFNGVPSPAAVWKCNDEVMTDTDRVHISSCSTSSVLEIKNIQYSDEGDYSCVVSNSLGLDTVSMSLHIEGPPMSPSKPVTLNPTTTSVKLKWSPPAHDGHYPVSSYLIEQLQKGFEDWRPIVQQLKTTFTVKTLDPNTWYQFRIIAVNEQGQSPPSLPSDRVRTVKTKGWMSPVTKKRFLLETDTASDDVDGRSLMPPVDDLSRTSSAVVLETNDSFIRQDSVHSNYELLSGELGRGRFGIVRSCVSKVTGSAAAAKYLKESHDVLQEVKILRNLSSGPSPSPHVILFIDALITDENIVIITEVADGGQLIDYILRMYNSLNELLIVEYVKQLLSALDYIHERQIVHLDVKPENLLIASEVAPILKLTDFGSAQEVPYAGLSVRPDLIEFSSPEVVFDDNVTKCTDLWSTGVITYLLLSGVSPFFHEYPSVSSQRLSRAQYDLSLQLFHSTSPQAIDFISALLKKQPAERLTAASALEHQWIKSCTSDKQITDISLSRLTVFQARRKLQVQSKAVKTTVIFNPSQTRPQSIGNESDTADTIAESAPLFEGGTEEIQAPVGASVTIEWDYTGLPAPSVQWEHNERAVVPSRRVQMSTIQGVTRLSIVELVKADEGTYTCCILNSLGSDIRNCALIVIDKPAPPSSVSGVLLGSSTSVLVSWLPPINDGHSPILHYSLDTRLVDDTDWSLVQERIDGAAYVVDDLLPGKSYLFRVSSTNVIGTSQFSKPSSPILITNDDYSPPGSSPLVTDLQVRLSDFNLEYEIINEIGRGSFSVVYECTELTTDRPFAAKFIKCSNDDQFSVALREFEMIKNVTHPRIASLEDAFRSENHVILVLQYVPGGDLFNYITSSGPIDERQSARYIRHILEGLEYLHNRNILLINIAPENLVLGVGLQEVKIIDFSHSKYLHSNPQLEILPQQINYLSPEALQCSPLALSTDLWSVGAVALFMLSGQCPFVSDTRDQLINNIHTLNINYKINPIIQRLSLDCTNMIFDGLLLTNESKRLSSHQCQRHRWLQAGVSSTALVPQLQSMNTMEQVQYFMDKYPTHFHSNSDPI